MNLNDEEMDLRDRLDLMQKMIAEGRRTTGRWGWIIVLWGIAFYVAFAWSALTHSPWAWPVTVLGAFVLARILHRHRNASQPRTVMSRAIGSIWIAMGVSMFILFPTIEISGRTVDPNLFMAVITTMLGTTNAASSMILKWKEQFACAVVWWLAALASCFGTLKQCMIAFLVAVFLCQIVFGIYGIAYEARMRKRQGAFAA
jgi:hypothetical protein